MRWRTLHVGIKGSMVVICRKNGNYRSVERQLLQCWLGPWVSEVSLNKFYHYIIVTKASDLAVYHSQTCLGTILLLQWHKTILPTMSWPHGYHCSACHTSTCPGPKHITDTKAPDRSASHPSTCPGPTDITDTKAQTVLLVPINMSWPQVYHWYKGIRPFCLSPINMSWPQAYHWYKGTDCSACHPSTHPGPKYITDTKASDHSACPHQHVLAPSISLIQRHRPFCLSHINMSWPQVYHWYKGTDRSACHPSTCTWTLSLKRKPQTHLPIVTPMKQKHPPVLAAGCRTMAKCHRLSCDMTTTTLPTWSVSHDVSTHSCPWCYTHLHLQWSLSWQL